MRNLIIILFLSIGYNAIAQEATSTVEKDSTYVLQEKKISPFSSGYYSIGFFDVDLRYLIKYNNYESIRLGMGGITNNRLSSRFRIGGYVAYGFKDQDYKYSTGAGYRIDKNGNTWISLYYSDDIKEIGSYDFLTDARIYSVFEPRLVNITQFYKHKTWLANIQHVFSSKTLAEVRLSKMKIEQIEGYFYVNNGTIYKNYDIAEITASIQINPNPKNIITEEGAIETYDGFPRISAQITQGIKGISTSDFDYTKIGLKFNYLFKRPNLSFTDIILEGKVAFGDAPLTHLYHAYPNNPTKDKLLQRFSVAGRSSFETMYFGEFFSDKLLTLQVKQSLRRFKFSEKIRPELVFITRHAIGDLKDRQKHVGIPFSTLDQLYSESGFELNRLLFGFGLSFAYRYGYYHLRDVEDNISFKFTFNLKI